MPKCNILDNHACITVSGNWRPCCRFNEKVQPWSQVMSANEYSYSEWRNSSFFTEVYNQQIKGWHEGCFGCKLSEDTGGRSTRLTFNEKLSGNKNSLEYIEISLSNECNLACKMCGPWASSTWMDILKNTNRLNEFFKIPTKSKPVDINKLFNNIDLSNIKTIKLLGGEPFITPQTHDFFAYLDDIGILEKIELMTSTNATFFPTKLLPYLNKIKRISMSLSIDGMYEVNDYVRYKSSWSIFDKTVNNWISFFKNRPDKKALKLSSVLNAYNVHQVCEIDNYAKDKDLMFIYNIINGPEYLKLEALPELYINYLKNSKIFNTDVATPILNYFNTIQHNKHLNKLLIQYTELLDKITQISLKNSNPILYKYLF